MEIKMSLVFSSKKSKELSGIYRCGVSKNECVSISLADNDCKWFRSYIQNSANCNTSNASKNSEERNIWQAFHAVKTVLKQCECGCSGNPIRCSSLKNRQLRKAFFDLRDFLLSMNMKFFRRTASIIIGTRPSSCIITRQDSINSAILAGIDCLHRYNVSHESNASFITFAYRRVRGEIIDELRRVQDFPNIIASMRREIKPKIELIAHELRKFPTLDDLKSRLTDEEFEKCTNPLMFSYVNTNSGYRDEDGRTVDTSENDERIISNIRRMNGRGKRVIVNSIDIKEILKDEELVDIIFMHYYLGMPSIEIAVLTGLSDSSISKKKSKAEDMIRDFFGKRSIMHEAIYG
jgi:RNA polymerase sigma factor for flagellar operon FliA